MAWTLPRVGNSFQECTQDDMSQDPLPDFPGLQLSRLQARPSEEGSFLECSGSALFSPLTPLLSPFHSSPSPGPTQPFYLLPRHHYQRYFLAEQSEGVTRWAARAAAPQGSAPPSTSSPAPLARASPQGPAVPRVPGQMLTEDSGARSGKDSTPPHGPVNKGPQHMLHCSRIIS